ncbi:MAG TPA: hypothetical protein VF250_04975 [Conexibacter sp.]
MGDGAGRWGRLATARSQHAWAALLLGGCVFAYLWPVLVGGRVLSPNAVLYVWPPWRASAPGDLNDHLNTLLTDLPLVDFPWRVLVRRLLHEGTFPAWNPYALSGIPLYANPQTGLFSPFNLPLWILPLTYGLGVSAALKLLVGGFGAYLLARELRLSFLPGVLAGVAFAFSAVNITWLAHETLPGVVVMAPWALWLVERILARGRPGSAIALAGVLAVALGGGHPSMQVHVLVVTAVYALVRAACLRGQQAGLGRALALVAGGILAAALLMAAMLLPEALSSRGTVGIAARQQGELASSRVPFEAILTTIVPDRWGRPSAMEAPVTAANHAIMAANYNERTFYAGTVALVLAFVGLLAPSGWRRKLPFAVVGLGALAVALHVPGLIWLARNLPVLELVQPERLHFAFELSVALLAAFGLQAVLDAPTALRRRIAVVAVAALCGIAVALAAGVDGTDVDRTIDHFLTGRSWEREGVLALTSVVWFLLFVLGAGALLLVARWRPAWRTGVAAAFVLLAAADAYHFVHGFQPMGPESSVIPPKTPALAYLERHRDDGRVMGLRPAMPPDSGLVYGLRDVRGYDPPQPTRRMLALWRLANPEQTSWEPLGYETVGLPQLQLLDVLGVRYVIADPDTPFSRDAIPTLTPVHRGDDALVLESSTAVSRVFVPSVVRVTEGLAATGRTVVEAGFEARREVAVERDQRGVEAFAGVHGTAAVTDERNDRVTLRARLDRHGLVVLNDALMEGWRVRVDGREASPVYVNGVMRGVVVAPGEHEIVWRYAVPGLRLGAVVSAVTFAALVAAAVVLAVRRRRASTLRA